MHRAMKMGKRILFDHICISNLLSRLFAPVALNPTCFSRSRPSAQLRLSTSVCPTPSARLLHAHFLSVPTDYTRWPGLFLNFSRCLCISAARLKCPPGLSKRILFPVALFRCPLSPSPSLKHAADNHGASRCFNLPQNAHCYCSFFDFSQMPTALPTSTPATFF